jgi:hypothetical protein
MAYLIESMLFVTFFLENDSLPRTDFLLDFGCDSLSSPFCYNADAGLFLIGLIIERKLFPC